MSRFLIRRFLLLVPNLIGVTVVVFAAIHLIPGDPAAIMVGDLGTPEDIEHFRALWGLDRSLLEQYLAFIGHLLQGDFGTSILSQSPVVLEIVPRLGATLLLATGAIVMASLVGITAGIVAGLRAHSLVDHATMILALGGVSTPIFWTGLVLMLVFSVRLQWFPAGGYGTLGHLILPVMTLGLFAAGAIARQARSSLLEVLTSDYVRTARAKGLSSIGVVWRHALKNALIPIVTVAGLQFGQMLGGSILTETVFSWPGIGSYLIQGISGRDYPVVQATIFTAASAFALVNLGVDLLYGLLDPRIRYE